MLSLDMIAIDEYKPRNAVKDAGRATPTVFFKVGWSALVFAIYLSAGTIKTDPRLSWIPGDLTIVFAGLTLVLTFITYATRKPVVNGSIFWVLAFYFLFILSGLYTEWTPYAIEKYGRFLTLTLLVSLAPFVLFNSWDAIGKLTNAMILIGIVITFDALSLFMQGVGHWNVNSRLTATSSNTIELGRFAGMVGIYIVLQAVERSMGKFLLSVAGLLIILVVMLGSGARGPILGAIIGLASTFIVVYHTNGKVMLRVAFLVVAAGMFIGIASALLPETSLNRIDMFFSKDALAQSSTNSSVVLREHAITVALDNIQQHPLGMGVGGFDRITRAFTRSMVYPHNIILEIFMESGWVAGIYFSVLMLMALYRSGRMAVDEKTVEARIVFCLTIFFLVNALVSGDLNDNRFLFVCISIILAVYHRRNAVPQYW